MYKYENHMLPSSFDNYFIKLESIHTVQNDSKVIPYSKIIIIHSNLLIKSKSYLHCTRDITTKRVMSGQGPISAASRLGYTAPKKRWRHCADLTGPVSEPQISRTDSVRLATELTAGQKLLITFSIFVFKLLNVRQLHLCTCFYN